MLSNKIPSCRHELQKNSVKRAVNSTWDKAHRWVRDRLSPQAFKTYLVVVELTQGKPKAISKRVLKCRRGVSDKTIYNHSREMIHAKVMRAKTRKISRCRNAPNTYVLLDIDGRDLHLSMEKNYREKLVQTQKLTTPPRSARVESSPAMRKLFEQNGRLWKLLRRVADTKAHRLRKAEERTRRASEAMVGVHAGTIEPMSDAERRAYEAEMAILDARRAERLAGVGR